MRLAKMKAIHEQALADPAHAGIAIVMEGLISDREAADRLHAEFRRGFLRLKRQPEPCEICGAPRQLSEAHHIYPLRCQADDGIVTPCHECVWLCASHHRAVHLLIKGKQLDLGWETYEFQCLSEIALWEKPLAVGWMTFLEERSVEALISMANVSANQLGLKPFGEGLIVGIDQEADSETALKTHEEL